MLTIVLTAYLGLTLLMIFGLCAAASRSVPQPDGFAFEAPINARVSTFSARYEAPEFDRSASANTQLGAGMMEAKMEKERLFEA